MAEASRREEAFGMRFTSHVLRQGAPPTPAETGARVRGANVDEMSDASFPASDPPAVWTWEVDRPQPSGPTAGGK
jgi:hypothetical protein